MSCAHPAVAQVFDRIRGTMTCGYCGEVVNDQMYEIDPAFARGDKPTGGGRPPPGFARPMRSTLLSNPGTNRPSIENARRGMQTISRNLEISQDDVEKAVAIFKLAVSNNAIAGSRPAALCACLYAVCRRANTPHTIFDFADATMETPFSILSYLKTICRATNTQLPSPDPTFYVHRLAQQLNLGDQTEEITILAVKILRAMNEEWLGYGRRPLGLCGAAVLVAANAFGVQRSVNDVVNFVRLSPDTIFLRMSEFLKTDAASLINIDEYKPSTTALPPALLRKQSHDWVQESSDRHLAQLYYSLLNEAKQSAPATEERCQRWREFIHLHCKLHSLEVVEDVLNLESLTPADQLAILGVKDATPANAETVSNLQEIEATRLIVSAAVAALGSEAPAAAVPTPSGSRSMAAGHSNSNTANASMMATMGTNPASPTSAAVGDTDFKSFDNMWGAMGGGGGEGDSTYAMTYAGEEVDEFNFGGGGQSGGGGGNYFGGGGGTTNDFGFGDETNDSGFGNAGNNDFSYGGFESGSGYGNGGNSNYGYGSKNPTQPPKPESTEAKAEGIKKEMMSSQVTSVHAMLQRFEQLRQLNNDVTSHVANVVQKARFDIIVLPPVHTDLGLPPPAPSQSQTPASSQLHDDGINNNNNSADPFASVPIISGGGSENNLLPSSATQPTTVKIEQMNSQIDGSSQQANSAEDANAASLMLPPAPSNSVIKISDLLSTSKNIQSTADVAHLTSEAASTQEGNEGNTAATKGATAPNSRAASVANASGHHQAQVSATSDPLTSTYNNTSGGGATAGSSYQLPPDLEMYIIRDLEVRLRLEAAGKRVFKEKWDAGAARGDDEVLQAEIRACIAHGDDNVDVSADGRIIGDGIGGQGALGADGQLAPMRRKTKIHKHATAAQAIKASLRNKGASQIDVNAIFGDEDAGGDGGNAGGDGEMSEGDDGGGWDD